MASLELLHFEYSTYNEKARWALDYKGVPHRRRGLLPGPHQGPVRKISGQTKTPVLLIDGTALAGSAAVIDWLETHYPDPPLYPADAATRARALEIQQRFDDDWGPRIRRYVLASLLEAGGFVAWLFATGQPRGKRLMYRAILPAARGLIRKGNGIYGPDDVADGLAAADEAFAFVEAESAATGYLAGDAFSVADLAACSMLAPLVNPPDCDMAWPPGHPPKAQAMLDRFAGRPGAQWVLSVYARHRPKRAPARRAA